MVAGPGTISSHFADMARTLGAKESDYLLPSLSGISTHSALYFRVPTSEALEAFITEEMYPYRAYEDGEDDDKKIEWFFRAQLPDTMTVNQFSRDREAQCLRQLLEVSRTLAKRDVQALAEGEIEGAAPKRLSLPMARDLEDKGKAMGFDLIGDYERPGPLTLAKVNANHAPGVIPSHLQWEEFTSVVEENKAVRKGLRPEM